MSCGAGEEVGWEDALGAKVIAGAPVGVGAKVGAGGSVGKRAKDLDEVGVALSLTFPDAVEVGWGSSVGEAVREAEEVTEPIPGVTVGSTEVEEVWEAPGLVEGALCALCAGRGDRVTVLDMLGTLRVETLGLPDSRVEGEKSGLELGDGVSVSTLAREEVG